MQDTQHSTPSITQHLAEQRYAHFFSEAPTMLVITRDQDGVAHIDDCNRLFQDTLGYPREEILGHPLADFYCPESRKALAEWGYRQALKSGIVDVERNLVRRDGSIVPTILRASPITDENGEVRGTHAAYIDIQVREEAEAALRRSEEQLRQALNAARMGIWEWDIRTDAITWSDQVEALFGLAPEEFAGTYEAYLALIHPDDRGLLEAEIERAFRRGDYAIVHRLIWPDGSLHWLEAKGRVVFDDAARPVRMFGTVMDITERRIAEEELRRSREQLSTTLENAPAYILTLNRSGAIIAANRLPEPLTVDEVIGQPIDILASPPHRDRPRAAFEQVLTTGRPVQYAASTRIVGGVERWFEVRLGPVVVDGEINQVIFIATDITGRVRTEETLRRFRVALDSSADGIFLVDPVSLRVLDVNDTACTVLGFTREEMLHISARELLPDVSQEELDQQFKRLIGDEESYGAMVIDVRTKSGEFLPIEVYLRALATPDGHLIVASGRNIRERKEAEAALRQERALLAERVEQRTAELRAANTELAQQAQELRRVTELQNAILTYGGTAILSTTPDGVIRTFNSAAEQLFGIAAADVIGQMTPVSSGDLTELSLHLIASQPASNRETDAFAALASAPGAETREWTFVRPDGSKVPVLLSVTALSDEAGNPIGYAGMANDISLHKQSEETLRRSEDTLRIANAELARALRLKDEFLANMSHELRTPLNAILNLSESLVEEIAGPLTDKQQTFCSMILESGQHLLALINDILDLSKIESGHADLEIVPVAVEPVCQSSLRMVAEQAKKKRLTSSIHIDVRAQWVHADARRLKQMLVNLLGNAVKFTPRGGRIGIEVNADAEAGKISFAVWDTGIGISSEDLPRLFLPFIQLDAGLSRQYGGSGLGLVLVSRMARIHGGGVHVESTPGKGSRFTIDLPWSADRSSPYAELGERTDRMPPSVSAAGDPRHVDAQVADAPLILLVDDTETVIAPIISYLEANHYRVATAFNGESAIEMARELQPDLILMDIQMPDIDGLEAVRWIRTEPGLESTPIVALTALAMPGDRERCLSNGMDDYLAKPVRLRNLARCIEANLGRKQP